MKFAAYFLLSKTCTFSGKIYYSYGDNEFFLRDCFFIGSLCIIISTYRFLVMTLKGDLAVNIDTSIKMNW